MSVPKKTLDAFLAAGEAVIDDNKTVDELQDSAQILKRVWHYADRETKKKVRPVLVAIYAWALAMIVVAFMQAYSFLIVMAVVPMAMILYVLAAEPFKIAVAGVADQRYLQGKLRSLVITIALWQVAAALLLRFIPLSNNPELGIWLTIIVVALIMSKMAPITDTIGNLQVFLLLAGIVITVALFFMGGNDSADRNVKQGQDIPEIATADTPNQEVVVTKNKPRATVFYDTGTEDPFYAVNECPGEPEVRRFRSDDPPLQITLPKGCWSAPIEMPIDADYSIQARTNINFMNTLGEVFTNRGWNNPGGWPEFQTFRLRSNSTEQQIKIEIDK
ncbi:MAG: hypothetical protein R3346_01970 [Candidatus Spechtbacterales bacterium]|nr:hypothetical protein [Candidatus Spechtbacterales bacterium]